MTTTQGQQNGAADAGKRGLYPYNSFQKCAEVARVVADNGGANREVDKSLIAQHFGMEESAGALLQTIGSCKTLGFLEGRGSYILTDRAKRYFFPESDADRDQARLEMLKMPVVFASLIERFDGQRLPAPENLVNILARDHVANDTWRPRIVSLFLNALRDANVIDGNGFLRYTASLHRAKNATVAPMKDTAVIVENPTERPAMSSAPHRQSESASAASRPVASDVDIWAFRIGNESVRLETSHELSMAAWTKLARYVEVLKPEQ